MSVLQLALTAATPVRRGFLADVDCRWDAIAQGTDDRTEEERGLQVVLHIILATNDHLLLPAFEKQPAQDS